MRLSCHKAFRVLAIIVIASLLITAGCGEGKKQCPKGQYRATPPGDCSHPGVCEDIPEICPDVWQPVCGCDGITYGNECEAAAAGMNIESQGKCPVFCSSNADLADPSGYCEKKDGDCDGVGSPAAKPEICPDIREPVCGCDGVTYGSRCEAAAAGVNIESDGACPSAE